MKNKIVIKDMAFNILCVLTAIMIIVIGCMWIKIEDDKDKYQELSKVMDVEIENRNKEIEIRDKKIDELYGRIKEILDENSKLFKNNEELKKKNSELEKNNNVSNKKIKNVKVKVGVGGVSGDC